MLVLSRILFALILFGSAIVFFMNIVEWFIEGISFNSPSKSRINRDFREMENDLEEFKSRLVRIQDKELEELSDFTLSKPKFKRRSKSFKSLVGTIFEEPAMAIAYKRYSSNQMNALGIARFRDREYTFRYRPKEVTIYLNQNFVGSLKRNGELRLRKKLLARIEPSGNLTNVLVEGREVASMDFTAETSNKVRNRIIKYVRTVDVQERNIIQAFYAMGIIEKITQE